MLIRMFAFLLLSIAYGANTLATERSVEFEFKNESSNSIISQPFSFAQVFLPGQFQALQKFSLRDQDSDLVIALQTDVKALHADGTIRHAIFSGFCTPLAANDSKSFELVARTENLPSTVARLEELLLSDWDATISLDVDAETYSVSVAELLENNAITVWMDGELSREWLVTGVLRNADDQAHQHLSARFQVRVYGNLEHVRLSVAIENGWAYGPAPKNVSYDAVVKINDEIVYQVDDLKHLHNARWRKVFWSNGKPSLHIEHDPNYLMMTGALPNYAPELIDNISPALLSRYQDRWVDETITRELNGRGRDTTVGSGGVPFIYNKIGPMGIGLAAFGMPDTGGRPDIGPLTGWAAAYLLSQKPIAKTVMLGMGDSAASWAIHYRDRETDLPLSIDQYPYASSHPNRNLSRNPATGQFEQVSLCPLGDLNDRNPECMIPYFEDTAHQPSFAYVPYLVTGDYYYLEELQFWANFNFLTMNPHFRGFSKGLFERAQQDRAQAWSMRKLGQTAYITPDDHPLKNYFEQRLQDNIEKYHQKYVVENPNRYGSMIPNFSYPTHSPWMDDFFTWSIGFIVGLGYEQAKPLLEWKAKFSVQRMGFGAPGFCWVMAAPYHLLVAPDKDSPMFQTIRETYDNTNGQDIPFGGGFDDFGTACGSQEMADALGIPLGAMRGGPSATSFIAQMQMGLAAAVESGIPGANQAWQRYSNRARVPSFNFEPNYAIVPRSINVEPRSDQSESFCLPIKTSNDGIAVVCL